MDHDLANANNLWIFREGKIRVPGQELRRDLEQVSASLLRDDSPTRTVVDALLRAGEFEAALGDADPASLATAEGLTNAVAHCLLGNRAAVDLGNAVQALSAMEVPDTLQVSPPEGFAYYALHPLDFAQLADNIAQSCSSAAAIIGIRSIGTTLSAIVLAAFQKRGMHAQRITVRPVGHPYDRATRFSPEQRSWIESNQRRGCSFFVVDEGPGRSGSSFLSVGEAIERADVPLERVTLLGSRPVDPNQLCASNGAARWNRFRFFWPNPAAYSRFENHIYIGGGDWRKELLTLVPSQWPASWQQMERFKFLSPDRKLIYKFDGFGRFGEAVLDRARQIARAGFGPPAEFAGDGMIAYPVLQGRILQKSDFTQEVLQRVADYCAFRASDFRMTSAPGSQLPEMVTFNMQHEFGREPSVNAQALCSSTPILADGRMQLHEWIIDRNVVLKKVDGCTHGDDHFFPGPTDIAWDLAGVIVEWELDRTATEFFISEYKRRTGDDVRPRLAPFLLAYAIFRMGYCKMALSSVVGTPEYVRLQQAATSYRNFALGQLRRPDRSAPVSQPSSSASTLQPAIQPQPESAA